MKVQQTYLSNQWEAVWFLAYVERVKDDTLDATPVMDRKHLPAGRELTLAVMQTILLNAMPAGNA